MSARRIVAIRAAVMATASALVVMSCGLLSGCTTSAPASDGTAADGRGSIVSTTELATRSAPQIGSWLGGESFDTSSVRFGVDTYRIVYRTVDARGRATTASGLLAVPRSSDELTLVSYAHGTTSYKPDAPSLAQDAWGPGPAIMYAASGFAAAAPDYLGLGEGPGRHPWMDVPSETSASLDFLQASRRFLDQLGRDTTGDVLVTGFSQGASAALGLARALADGADPDLRLRAVAPVSGAYAFRDAEIPAMLDGHVDQRLAVAYTAYLFTSWNHLHGGIYDAPTEIFRQPYADHVDSYFDGTTPGQIMLAGLPATLDELLTPRGFSLLRRPTGSFARALSVADDVCHSWNSQIPLRLYTVPHDEQVTPDNTDRCIDQLRRQQAAVQRVTLPNQSYAGSAHLGSNIASIDPIVEWFSSLIH